MNVNSNLEETTDFNWHITLNDFTFVSHYIYFLIIKSEQLSSLEYFIRLTSYLSILVYTVVPEVYI